MGVVPKVLVTSTFVDEQRLWPTPWVLAPHHSKDRQQRSPHGIVRLVGDNGKYNADDDAYQCHDISKPMNEFLTFAN
jgi:hypothetical protein